MMYKFNKNSLFKELDKGPNTLVKYNPTAVSDLLSRYGIQLKEDTTLQYHQSINPKIWMPDNSLKPDVKEHLVQIANQWIEFAKIDKAKVKDIVLTGGNANYNYTDLSDLDVHVIVDYTELGADREFISEFLKDKKELWAEKHPNVRVMGYPVELYAQDVSEVPHFAQGVFSLMHDDWTRKPEHLDISPDKDPVVSSDSEVLIKKIDDVVNGNRGLDEAKAIWDEIASLRKNISTEGEFSEKNLVFKNLRNLGALDKITHYIKFHEDMTMSLGEDQ